jgi:hypothetical protein
MVGYLCVLFVGYHVKFQPRHIIIQQAGTGKEYRKKQDKLIIKKLNSVALVRERIIPIERPPLVGEVSANFCG